MPLFSFHLACHAYSLPFFASILNREELCSKGYRAQTSAYFISHRQQPVLFLSIRGKKGTPFSAVSIFSIAQTLSTFYQCANVNQHSINLPCSPIKLKVSDIVWEMCLWQHQPTSRSGLESLAHELAATFGQSQMSYTAAKRGEKREREKEKKKIGSH